MNEQKRSRREYFNPESTKQSQTASELLALIQIFITRNTITPSDLTVLKKLIKQLNAHKNDLPSKVIRSMTRKFEVIQAKYER